MRFLDVLNPTVRFGAVIHPPVVFGAVPIPVDEIVQHRFFSTVHRKKRSVCDGSHIFGRGTNETALSLLFLYRAP